MESLFEFTTLLSLLSPSPSLRLSPLSLFPSLPLCQLLHLKLTGCAAFTRVIPLIPFLPLSSRSLRLLQTFHWIPWYCLNHLQLMLPFCRSVFPTVELVVSMIGFHLSNCSCSSIYEEYLIKYVSNNWSSSDYISNILNSNLISTLYFVFANYLVCSWFNLHSQYSDYNVLRICTCSTCTVEVLMKQNSHTEPKLCCNVLFTSLHLSRKVNLKNKQTQKGERIETVVPVQQPKHILCVLVKMCKWEKGVVGRLSNMLGSFMYGHLLPEQRYIIQAVSYEY